MKKYKNIKLIQIINYYLPVSAIISIIHRITGILIFIFFPTFLFILDYSLESKTYFENIINNLLIKFFLLIFSSIYIYHLLSGIRFILLNIHILKSKNSYHFSAIILILINILYFLYFYNFLFFK